ncbi:MAG: hypothetical protein ACJ77N_03690, partial [Chloroflexota bacterium]
MVIRPNGLPPRLTLVPTRFNAELNRATVRGLFAGVLVAVLVTTAVPVPAPGLARAVIAAFAGAATGVAIAALLFRGEPRAAYDAFSWLGRWEVNRFAERTGTALPTDVVSATSWLDEHRDRGHVHERLGVLALAGRLDEAIDLIARSQPPTSPYAALAFALQAAWIRWLATGERSTEPLPDLAAVHDTANRLRGRVAMALQETRYRLEDGRSDWASPLAVLRPELGRAPDPIVVRDTWRPIFVTDLL